MLIHKILLGDIFLFCRVFFYYYYYYTKVSLLYAQEVLTHFECYLTLLSGSRLLGQTVFILDYFRDGVLVPCEHALFKPVTYAFL